MKITEDLFNEIKHTLDTPVLIDPPIRDVADEFGISSSVVSVIKKSATYEDYKIYQRKARARILRTAIAAQNMIGEENIGGESGRRRK